MRRVALTFALLVSLVGCSDPTATPLSTWFLSGDASAGEGYCVLTMTAEVQGTPDDFRGEGVIGFTTLEGFEQYEAEIRSDGETVRAGPFELAVERAVADTIGGTWACEGVPGVWRMRRR